MNFYIFRHGQTFATKKNSGYGVRIFSAPILEEGKPVIKKLAEYLKEVNSDFNVSSKIKRCRQTVDLVAEVTGKQFVFDSRLNEFFIETIGHFHKRIKSLLIEIEAKKYENVIICTHGAGIAALIYLITNIKSEKGLFNYPDPGVLVVIKDGKVTEISFN